MTGDSLLLERIIDIVPLGAGPDQVGELATLCEEMGNCRFAVLESMMTAHR